MLTLVWKASTLPIGRSLGQARIATRSPLRRVSMALETTLWLSPLMTGTLETRTAIEVFRGLQLRCVMPRTPVLTTLVILARTRISCLVPQVLLTHLTQWLCRLVAIVQ